MGKEKEYTEDNVRETNYQAGKMGIVALGLYLTLFTLLSFSGLITLMMADTGTNCCKNEQPTPTPIPAINSNTNSNSNGNADSNSSVQNSNTNVNAVPKIANSNQADANSNTNKTVTNTNKTETNTNSKSANANTAANAAPTPLEQQFPQLDVPQKVKVWWLGAISADSFLLLIVLFAGMVGGLMRGIFSFTKHLGLGDFSFKWTWFYLLLPFTGGALSMILYLVIRGGFYSSSYGKGLVLNVFSFAAVGALAGLFTENAMEKLKQVAKVLLADTTPKIPNAKDAMKQRAEGKKSDEDKTNKKSKEIE